jgi:hypothetical protein
MYEIEEAGVDFARLQAHLAGRVVLPGDEGWDLARQAFNLLLDRRAATRVVLR